MDNQVSRRRFLKNTALAGAGVVAGAVAVNQLSSAALPETPAFELNRGYWSRSQPELNPALGEDLEVDFAIVGGGYTGLSAAYHIRKNSPGKRVALLEARGCGNGASGRNGAMVLTMTADRYMVLSSDPAMDKWIYDLTADNIQRLHELSAETRIDCELDTKGSLQVLNRASDVAMAEHYVEQARAIGIPVELWSKEQTVAALGTSVYEGALFDPNGGQVHPMKLVHALKAAAENAGAAIYENTPIVNIEEGAVHRLKTLEGHSVRAKALVLATNAYTSKLGYFRNAVTPIFNFVGITPPLSPQVIADIGWHSRMPFDDSRTLVYYLGLTRENRIHIGGGTAEYPFNNDLRNRPGEAHAYARLQQELVRIFPRLTGVEFETTWSGIVDMTLDFAPSVGRAGKQGNIYYGLGYCGHGVNLTSLFGRIIADLEAGHDDKWRALPFVNHKAPYVPNEPFRWLGVQALVGYYRMTDP
jgi:glycine/D-amino acid oxidase-like deaminating enzyme